MRILEAIWSVIFPKVTSKNNEIGVRDRAQEYCRRLDPFPWDLTQREWDKRCETLYDPTGVPLPQGCYIIVASTNEDKWDAVGYAQKWRKENGLDDNAVPIFHDRTPEGLAWLFFGPGEGDKRTVPLAVIATGTLRDYSGSHDMTVICRETILTLCESYCVKCLLLTKAPA